MSSDNEIDWDFFSADTYSVDQSGRDLTWGSYQESDGSTSRVFGVFEGGGWSFTRTNDDDE